MFLFLILNGFNGIKEIIFTFIPLCFVEANIILLREMCPVFNILTGLFAFILCFFSFTLQFCVLSLIQDQNQWSKVKLKIFDNYYNLMYFPAPF